MRRSSQLSLKLLLFLFLASLPRAVRGRVRTIVFLRSLSFFADSGPGPGGLYTLNFHFSPKCSWVIRVVSNLVTNF